VLKQLAESQAIVVTEDGYLGDAERLLELYRDRARPSVSAPDTYWYSTRSALDQANLIIRRAQTVGVDIAFSADLAPDLLVPWRHPTLTIVYVSASCDISSAGFVPAEGRADATLIMRVTPDRTLVAPPETLRRTAEGIPIVDPTQQWWDLLDLGGDDRREAALRLRTAILDRTIPGGT
jgi:hypothetical protein